MKSVIPTMLMLIGITIMTAVAVCFLSFQMQVSAAENLHAESMAEIQAAKANPATVAYFQRKAEEVLGSRSSLQVAASGDCAGTAVVKLTYYADMPVFQLSRRGVIEGCIYTGEQA